VNITYQSVISQHSEDGELRVNSKFYDVVIAGDILADPPIADPDNKY
jgi:hypothetical protein